MAELEARSPMTARQSFPGCSLPETGWAFGDWPYRWLGAADLKQREGGRIVSVAATIAVAANKYRGQAGNRGPAYRPVRRGDVLVELPQEPGLRGLHGTKLVISDTHGGLKAAIRRVTGSAWQRCRVGLLKKSLRSDSVSGATAWTGSDGGRKAARSIRVSDGRLAPRACPQRPHSCTRRSGSGPFPIAC